VFGARGTGKTRLLHSLFPAPAAVLWIDLLNEGERLQFLRVPPELRSRLNARKRAHIHHANPTRPKTAHGADPLIPT
jgi:hypothetical protein